MTNPYESPQCPDSKLTTDWDALWYQFLVATYLFFLIMPWAIHLLTLKQSTFAFIMYASAVGHIGTILAFLVSQHTRFSSCLTSRTR